MPDLKVLSQGEFAGVMANNPDGWRFWSFLLFNEHAPTSDMPIGEQASDWLFLPGKQNCAPFWYLAEYEEWVTQDGPCDIGYVAKTTKWSVETDNVEWNEQVFEYVGHIEQKGGPSFEVYRPIDDDKE